MSEVRVSLQTIYDELQAVKASVQLLAERDSTDDRRLGDHETRLRLLERIAWTALGAGLLSGFGVAVQLLTG